MNRSIKLYMSPAKCKPNEKKKGLKMSLYILSTLECGVLIHCYESQAHSELE